MLTIDAASSPYSLAFQTIRSGKIPWYNHTYSLRNDWPLPGWLRSSISRSRLIRGISAASILRKVKDVPQCRRMSSRKLTQGSHRFAYTVPDRLSSEFGVFCRYRLLRAKPWVGTALHHNCTMPVPEQSGVCCPLITWCHSCRLHRKECKLVDATTEKIFWASIHEIFLFRREADSPFSV